MRRHGGILLEMMIALALFVGAALFILRATSQARMAVDRAVTQQRAVDLATTRLAELETGLITLSDLRSGFEDSRPEFGSFDSTMPVQRLRLESRTERSAFPGLTLLKIDVLDAEQVAADGGARTVFTIRKLIRISEDDIDAYEQDELLDDLPEEESSFSDLEESDS